MPAVAVSPERFTMVSFDAGEIRSIVEQLAREIGLPDHLPIAVDVDESVPLARARIRSVEPVVLDVQGGALEDSKRLRAFSPQAATRALGRLLFQVRDLLDPAFGDPPPDDELSLQLRVAWDVNAAGRLERLGHPAQRQRWLYAFRTRHGFSDEVDRAFEHLWQSGNLVWGDIERCSAEALHSVVAA
jgi:hypothetical protein